MSQRIGDLAAALGVDSGLLGKHLASMLPPETYELPDGWPRHEQLDRLHLVCDSFWLFGNQPWNGFEISAYRELATLGCSFGELDLGIEARGLLPIAGHGPHYISLRTHDGAIVRTDWDNVGGRDWLAGIAPSLGGYVATLIEIRESYARRFEHDSHPADWWRPYAMDGIRLND